MRLNRRPILAALLAASCPWVPGLRAQTAAWSPERPIRLVVPFAAGGGTDVVARVLAERLGAMLGQPVVVENRTGASGNIGVEAVVRSPADGHVLLMGTMGTLTINPHLFPSLGFDPLRDLAPVGMAFATDHALIVHPAVEAATLAEFVALAKARPGRLAYGSAGAGSSTHMVAELFRLVAGIEVQHVPYRGSAPALNDTVAGTVQFMLDQLASALHHRQGGRVRALAVTGARRHPLLPAVPTVAEAGLPDAAATSWGAVMAPAGTPPAAIARLNAALAEALAQPAVAERLAAAGADAQPTSPSDLGATMRRETDRWGRVVREARISLG